ncbi:hypothetical protein [Phenylobacterium sp.]|uniref:hypothetical protein n=1 Tax=Phenylobacterium sp. TaxID=1871053 RepID=UPI0035B4E294
MSSAVSSPPRQPISRRDVAGFSAFAVLALWLIHRHAPWFDEAHALLIARAPWRDLLHNLKYEGHPALWYLWLGSIDRLLGGSPHSLPLAQAPISLGLLALIWFRSPFPLAAKLLLSAGYYFGFEYAVISRSYGLGALLLLASVPLRRSLWGWVCLALAANTAAHVALAAGVLGGVYLLERPQWRGPAILALGLALAVLTVFPQAADLYPTSGAPRGAIPIRVLVGLSQLSGVLLPGLPSDPYRWQHLAPGFYGVGVGLMVPVLFVLAVRDRRLRLGFFALFLALLVMAMAVYQLSNRHAGVLYLFFVCALWIGLERGRRLNPAAWIWLSLVAACGVIQLVAAQTLPFTYSRALGAWLRAHRLDQATWAAFPGRAGTLLTLETGKPTINLEKDCLNTFVRWDYPHERVGAPLEHVARDGAQYVISETRLSGGELLTHFPHGFGWGPPVWLYRFESAPRPVATCR